LTISEIDGKNTSVGQFSSVSVMKYDRIIEVTLRQVQDVLSQNLRGAIADAKAVSQIRGYLSRPSVQDGVHKSNDTIVAFALRAANQILSDLWAPPVVTIKRLRECFDDSELSRALGQSLPIGFWIKKPPA
jgi:hypothetical protein